MDGNPPATSIFLPRSFGVDDLTGSVFAMTIVEPKRMHSQAK